jgi:hypothetical protein
MTTLKEFRSQYPQYDDVSDGDLAGMLHKKFYSDIPRADFDKRIGLASAPVAAPRDDLADTAMITGAGAAKGLRGSLDPRAGATVGMNLFPPIAGAMKAVGADKAVAGLKAADPVNYMRQFPGAGQFMPSPENAETYSSPDKTAKALGAEMTPLRKGLAAGSEILGASVPMMINPAGAMFGAASATLGGAGEMIGGETGKTIGAFAPLALALRGRGQAPKAPTAEALKDEAQQAYKAAENAGVVISETSLANTVTKMARDAVKEGMHPKLHPRAAAALEAVGAEMNMPLTLERAEVLRRVLKGAASTADASERRLVMRMVDKFDDFVGNLKPADVLAGDAAAATESLAKARNLWGRARKSEFVDDLMERARTRASQFSGSGYENALRTEFRNAVMNPKKLRMFSPEEQAALKRVAKGGPLENILRMVGKFAPTGVVSSALSGGAGFAVGGPAGAIALPAAGFAARKAATGLTERNAKFAAEMMRAGKNLSPASRRLLERYLSAAGISTAGSGLARPAQ